MNYLCSGLSKLDVKKEQDVPTDLNDEEDFLTVSSDEEIKLWQEACEENTNWLHEKLDEIKEIVKNGGHCEYDINSIVSAMDVFGGKITVDPSDYEKRHPNVIGNLNNLASYLSVARQKKGISLADRVLATGLSLKVIKKINRKMLNNNLTLWKEGKPPKAVTKNSCKLFKRR